MKTPRYWRIIAPHKILFLLIVVIVLVGRANAQAVRFDQDATTTSPQCASGKQCPINALPGTQVNFCSGQNAGTVNTAGKVVTWVSGGLFSTSWTGQISINGTSQQIQFVSSTTSLTLVASVGTLTGVTYSSLSACLASPATTYTDFTAGTPCPTTAQLTPQTGGACLSTADVEGNYGGWLLPGQYSYYLRVPTTAGGGTYGPYPINVGASAGCPLGVTCDASFQTLALACTAAGTGTLYLTQTWGGLTTQTLACNIQALSNGIIKPASGQIVTLSGSFNGTMTRHFDLSAAGSVDISSSNVREIYPQWLGAVLDGTTDDTTAVSQSLSLSAGKSLYLTGIAAVSSVTITTSNSISVSCADPQSAGFTRVSSALQASTPLLKVTNAASVNLHDCGWNELGDGSNYTNAASTVYLATVGDVTIDNNFSTLAQSNAFIIAGASGTVKFTNNTCTYFWNSCLAASGSGTVASPVYLSGLVASNNYCAHGPLCLLPTIFVRNVAITGNAMDYSSIALIQDVNYSTISGNEIHGTTDYGVSPFTGYDCLFMEGVTDFNVSGNWMDGCASDGIFVQGSELTVGTTEQLPISRGSIVSNHVDAAAGFGISLIARSFDHSMIGAQNSVRSNYVTNSLEGITLGASDDFDISDNTIDTIGLNGIELSVVTNGRIKSNRIFRVSQTTINTNYGIFIGNDNATITHDLFINDNLIVDTAGNMRAGVDNDALDTGGYQNLVRHSGNVVSGQFAGNLAWYPQPAAPTSGTWNIGDRVENFPTSVNQSQGWINTAAGTPGTWSRTGTVIGPNCAAVADGSNNASCGASASGYFTISANSNFTNVFTSAQQDTSVINVTQTSSAAVGTLLGVTCNTTFSGGFVQSTLGGGGRFTVNTSASSPVTNPACYQFNIVNNQ